MLQIKQQKDFNEDVTHVNAAILEYITILNLALINKRTDVNAGAFISINNKIASSLDQLISRAKELNQQKY